MKKKMIPIQNHLQIQIVLWFIFNKMVRLVLTMFLVDKIALLQHKNIVWDLVVVH